VFAGVLDQTLAERRADLTRLVVDTINAELREVAEHWYRSSDRDIRSLIDAWAVQLRRVDTLARASEWAQAQSALAAYRNAVQAELPQVAPAEPRSTYDPAVLADYLEEVRGVAAAALR
jgi:hypothetical protein